MDNDPATVSPFAGICIHHGVAGFEAWFARLEGTKPACMVDVGGARGQDRVNVQQFMQNHGLCPLGGAVHPTAFVADTATIGVRFQILARANVCADVRLGDACVINNASSVGHESTRGVG